MGFEHVWRQLRPSVLLGVVAFLATSSLPAAAASTAERYIVVFGDSVPDAASTAAQQAAELGGRVESVYEHALSGYAGIFTEPAVQRLKDDGRVLAVERDRRVRRAAWTPFAPPTPPSGPGWGLDRIDQRARHLDGSFVRSNTGAGVTAYVIDTGIRYDHAEFGGRAGPGVDMADPGGDGGDCDGHGTHVAGILGGASHGVAPGVTLQSVRVLDCRGDGYLSDIVQGIDWITADHEAGAPAVANLSIEGIASTALDAAIRRAIADGVTMVVAAGNSGRDACRRSPSRVGEAITIGATGNLDRRAGWSSYGKCVDWFAPGVGIRSAWISSGTASRSLSGTSAAAPFTSGVVAQYLQSYPSATPQEVRDALFGLTTKGVVSGARSVNNHLLFTNL
jgi:subtilisin family serine protease